MLLFPILMLLLDRLALLSLLLELHLSLELSLTERKSLSVMSDLIAAILASIFLESISLEDT